MSLAITEDHRELAKVVRDIAAKHQLTAQARAALSVPASEVDTAWPVMAELGWCGLHLPEENGGAGFGLAELAVVLDELGAAIAPGPFLAAAIGSAVLAATGTEELRHGLLPAAASGESVIAYAVADELTVAEPAGSSGTASGPVAQVLGGVWADHLVLARGRDVLVVSVAGGGVAREPVTGSLDPSLGLARFSLTDAPATVIPGAAPAALAIARALACASAAGGARATLEMATGYAKIREQFGRTIGSFQAVKHLLADMLIDSELATAAAWDAARVAAAGGGQAELCGAVAAAVALAGFQRNAQRNIQAHGGIGFTWEHDAHLYLRRALTLHGIFGPQQRAQDDVVELRAAGVQREIGVDLPEEAEASRPGVREFASQLRAAPDGGRRRLWAESGYMLPHWPKPWGRAAGPVEQLVIEEELTGIPRPSMGIGEWVVLTITQHGTPEQLERLIWPSLYGELIWCQLFSEPGAGSDAAAVATKAVKVEGGWRVTGQKVWTSTARYCNRGLATVRTDSSAPKHKGITMMAINLKAPGVEVRPLREITGAAMFNEVFFDDVFVPDEDVVGEVNAGWTVARSTLGNERVSIGGGGSGGSMGGSAISVLPVLGADAGLRRELGGLLADEQAMRAINLRRVARAVAGAEPGPEGSVTKLLVSVHGQRVAELDMRALGATAVDGSAPGVVTSYLYSRCMTIAGGTTEIAKNVIAERILGLPRDPLVR
jgi:alkylation response protein AidB-like acyl-CoA dehydrogenase